ncbi:hypothetical protein CC78DRAFT_196022 [Lojkania enalia]|uniref:Uncharacterized protein n=1 Tax=Lojkania enalia TaxID=147567 RepID=A0A9P4TQP5_9PLEO|nr:hypothetical protein CC78DRAFT_196022 [Didymosphaeria enalia]
MAAGIKKSSKPIFKTEIPFTETRCPQISPKDQDVILDLLCNLLSPLGHHRKTHNPPSQGKKRKRKSKSKSSTNNDSVSAPLDISTPPVPPLSKCILVGLNSVTRHMSSLASLSAPSAASAITNPDKEQRTEKPSVEIPVPISVLIIPHLSPQSSLSHAHLPTLFYLSTHSAQLDSSIASSLTTPSRLIALPTSAEAKLASALHLPRVGALGILEGAPGAEALLNYVRDTVGDVECPWIEEGLKAEWKGVKVGI